MRHVGFLLARRSWGSEIVVAKFTPSRQTPNHFLILETRNSHSVTVAEELE